MAILFFYCDEFSVAMNFRAKNFCCDEFSAMNFRAMNFLAAIQNIGRTRRSIPQWLRPCADVVTCSVEKSGPQFCLNSLIANEFLTKSGPPFLYCILEIWLGNYATCDGGQMSNPIIHYSIFQKMGLKFLTDFFKKMGLYFCSVF